jgi:hypothetical protein
MVNYVANVYSAVGEGNGKRVSRGRDPFGAGQKPCCVLHLRTKEFLSVTEIENVLERR